MKVLVTGGTGFIGSRLALRCLEDGRSLRVTGQSRTAVEAQRAQELESRGAELVVASVTDRAALGPLLEGVEVVYHLAAAQHEANVPDQHFRDVNVEGTRNLLEASVAAGVRRFVHGSTIGVYGWPPGSIVTDDSPLEPDNIYGETKLEGEQVVRSFGGRIPWVIVRISETYGPGDRRLLKVFKGVGKGVFFGIGPGENQHHLVHVDDLIEGLRLAASRETAVGKTLVLAGERSVSTREMIAAIAAALGAPVPRLRLPLRPLLSLAACLEAVLRPLGIQPPLHRRRMDFFRKSFSFSGQAARRHLGYVPRVGLAEGMAATARWYREQGLL